MELMYFSHLRVSHANLVQHPSNNRSIINKHIIFATVIPEIAQRDVIHDGDDDRYSKVITDKRTDRQTYRERTDMQEDGRMDRH